MTRYDFEGELRRSAEHANDPFWGDVYRQAFPDFYNRIVVTELKLQLQGIDSVIQLKGGGSIKVDEKVRDPSDLRGRLITPGTHGILLEEWSSVKERKDGWWRAEKQTDYLAYAFLATHECAMIPFQALRRTRIEFGADWLRMAAAGLEGFREIKSSSQRGSVKWETFSIAVPLSRLKSALAEVMVIKWGGPRPAAEAAGGRCQALLPSGSLCGVKIVDQTSDRCHWCESQGYTSAPST